MNSTAVSFATTATTNSIACSSNSAGRQPQAIAIWSSTSFSRMLTIPQGPLNLLINKPDVIDERSITPDLSKKKCKVITPENRVAGGQGTQPSGSGQASATPEPRNSTDSSSHDAKQKCHQHVDIGNTRYTREELADMPLQQFKSLFSKEGNEVERRAKYLRRKEKNRFYAEKKEVKKRTQRNRIIKEIKALQSKKESLKSENNDLRQEVKSIRKNSVELEKLLFSYKD